MNSSLKMKPSKLTTSNRRGLQLSSSTSSRVKMKIKPFKRPPAPPADLYDRTFSLLLAATNAILRKQPLVARPTYPAISPTGVNNRNIGVTISGNRSASPTSVAPSSSMRDSTNAVVYSVIQSSNSPLRRNENESVPISKEELYRGVEDLCVHGYSNKLFNDVCKILENGAMYCLRKLTDERSSNRAMGAIEINEQVVFHNNLTTFSNDFRQSPIRFLDCAQQVYSDYLDYLTFVRSIFLYLDRTYVFGKTKVKTLYDVGIDIFRRYTMYDCNLIKNENSSQDIKYSNIIQTLIQATLHQIRSERDGEVVDRVLLRNTIRMFADIPGCFYDNFIPQLVAESMVYFENEGMRWMEKSSSGTASEFLAKVEKRWAQANDMSIYYLECSAAQNIDNSKNNKYLRDSSLQGKNIVSLLASVVEQKLLLPHIESFLLQDKQLYPLLNDNSKLVPDLKRLYILLRRVSKLDELRAAFGRYGRITGTRIVEGNPIGDMNNVVGAGSAYKDANKDIIPNLLIWKDRLETIHRVAFMSDDSFGFSVTLHPSNKSAATNYNQILQKASKKTIAPTGTTSCLRGVLEDVLNGSSLSNNRKQDAHEYGKRVAELLAKHVDLCLRSPKALASSTSSTGPPNNQLNASHGSDGSLNKINESDPEQKLERIMSLFRYLQSKDIFEAFFKRYLAKRLLLQRSASIDLERLFISKLKTECGTGYTAKMEGMFKDMDLSREVMLQYTQKNLSKPKTDQDIDIDVQILTTGYWPVYKQLENLQLHSTLQEPLSTFESYYKDKYQGRRIIWQHSLGNCNVKAHFPHGTKDLVLSLYQTMVLVQCFNEWDDDIDEYNLGKGWTISEIMAKTGMDDKEECERVLQSLSVGKEGTRVLIKRDHNSPVCASLPHSKKRTKHTKEGKSVLPTDTFHYNHNFSSRQTKIRITSIQIKETTQERDDTQQSVSRDRLCLIDAAIVRIMKARKTVLHKELLGEVMIQLRFPATTSDIKKRIEGLLSREYMQRSDDGIDKYNYLA